MSHDQDTLSDAIMIMPYGSANPKYRDKPNEYVCQIMSRLDSSAVKLIALGPHQYPKRLERNSYLLFCRCRSSSCPVSRWI
jgi:hypothetical protein